MLQHALTQQRRHVTHCALTSHCCCSAVAATAAPCYLRPHLKLLCCCAAVCCYGCTTPDPCYHCTTSFVPARILRSVLKRKLGYNVPIQTVGLALYDIDGSDPATSPVQRTQWLVYGDGPGQVRLNGQRVLIVDEVSKARRHPD